MYQEDVRIEHGSGGRATHDLIKEFFIGAFQNEALLEMNDSAVVEVKGARLALTTDSFVVDPIFFPGGNIGSLAVHGTVNDLAMSGARPLYITAGFILEEGLKFDELRLVVDSMAAAAREASINIVAGDTKVVPRGKADKLFINTAGVGLIPPGVCIGGKYAKPGDNILINGTIGDHGLAIICQREGLFVENKIQSDSNSLHDLTRKILEVCAEIHVFRDPTRGGVAAALNEIAAQSGVGISLEEAALPVRADVEGACELLGLDPLYVANEGKVLVFVPPESTEDVLQVMKRHPLGVESCKIGEVIGAVPGQVFLKTLIGGRRVVDMPLGEPLPRIC